MFKKIAVLLLTMALFVLPGCGKQSTLKAPQQQQTELICLADSETQARQVAEQYGIEFKSYAQGVAVFVTDKNPEDLIEKGKANGWPLLAKNDKVFAF